MIQMLCAPGVPGLLVGLAIFLFLWLRASLSVKGETFLFEPRGPGSFEPLLQRYTLLAQFIIGLATGSIVLLAGSSVFKSGGRLPWQYASPLVLLSLSVIYGVCFMGLLLYNYESFLHNQIYTRVAYTRNTALGFSSLFCFAIGYLWLAFRLADH
ncbi:MAG: hypothetical protein HY234_10155 [Acidobacteria bacterium]|nr:hypothetical protein [Acidobacteriota bacterium]